ncbi:MAG TPA: murein biosynthesis integral membrane protein MurJ, partial [Deltaproteobacteria bacterium]|nr:murein biosynthesis integral membrane protein MurJ [Deltaproteobacteria bacterium]
MKRSARRNIIAVGGLTGISRILGFVRDMVMAWILGAGVLTDAFIVAFRIPNLLRRFMAEGTVSVAFIPVFSEAKEKEGIAKAFELTRDMLPFMFYALTAVVIIGEIIAPAMVGALAPGFLGDPVFDVAVRLTRIMFPFILLIGIAALLMGILNSLGHFTAPAGAPVLLNVFMIGVPVAGYVMYPIFDRPEDAFAWGVILGGIAQIILQMIPLRIMKVPLRFTAHFYHPRLRQVLKLMGVAAIGASVYQLNVFIGTLLASLLPTGSVSYLYYASRILELPLGLFAFSVSNVMLPALSTAFARSDREKVASLTGDSMIAVLIFTIPATIGMLVLAEPIFAVLFMRGKFAMADVHASAFALQMYALGLSAVGASRILTQTLYAMQQPKEVVKTAWISLIINALCSVALMPFMGHGGIALYNRDIAEALAE